MNVGTGFSPRTAADAQTGSAPAGGTPPTGWRAWLEANKRAALLLAVTLPVAAGGAGYLLLFSGSDPVDGGGSAAPAPAATSAPAPTPTEAGTAAPSATATGGSSAGSSRNPFAPKPAASTTGTGAGTSTASASDSATTVTATVTDPAVYLTLFSIAADGTAKFSVNGTGYSQSPGDTFGEGKALTYHKKVTVSGTTCASVSYNDQTDTVCPGEMHQVG